MTVAFAGALHLDTTTGLMWRDGVAVCRAPGCWKPCDGPTCSAWCAARLAAERTLLGQQIAEAVDDYQRGVLGRQVAA